MTRLQEIEERLKPSPSDWSGDRDGYEAMLVEKLEQRADDIRYLLDEIKQMKLLQYSF